METKNGKITSNPKRRKAAKLAWSTMRRQKDAMVGIVAEAKSIGFSKGDLEMFSADQRAIDKEYASDVLAVLRAARSAFLTRGCNVSSITMVAGLGKDVDYFTGMDEIAAGLGRQFPHVLGQDPEQRLFELLVAGNPQVQTTEEYYRKTLKVLKGR